MTINKPILWFLIAITTASVAQTPATKARYANLAQALRSGGQLAGSTGPRSVNWIEGGKRFSYLDKAGTIKAMTPAAGQATPPEAVVFDAKGLTFPGTTKAFDYESFQWSKDAKNIVFKTNFRPVYRRSGVSDYYLYSLADKQLKLIAKDAQTAELSPDGKQVGYERGGNLFVFDVAGSGGEKQLTNTAKAAFYNGRFGWAYEEEFGLAQAWVWSPDSKFIAFWQTDERAVPIYRLTNYQGFRETYDSLPYPRVGDRNPGVRIGAIEVANGKTNFMQVEGQEGYIPRIYWTAQEGQLALVHLNRKQNELTLYMTNARTGAATSVMTETSKTWVDIFDFFAGVDHLFYFPEGVNEYYWVSDRDGWAHLYRYDYTGKLLNQVTKGNFEVSTIQHIDVKAKKVYFTSTEASPLERQLYVVDADGKNKRRLTPEPGRHYINFSPNGQTFIDRYSNVNTPTQVLVRNVSGQTLATLEANNDVKTYVAANTYSPKELSSFTTSDGQRIEISILKPADFDVAKKYPVVLDIYGGPGAQSVYNEWHTQAWQQYLTQQGYVIVGVNNRGSGGYGQRFEKQVYEKLGQFESLDFAETAKYMAALPWVDGARMAIRGHSYGGYMSSYTMLTHPGVFKVSLVGAPVTDWRLYDSIYTERYMGLVPENDAAYAKSAVTTYAKNLAGKMFIAHSTMDENVHVRNTFQLMNALEDAGKDADLRIYPPGAHGVAYNQTTYLLLYQQYVDYLAEHLN
ncbi:S9 family peptidase [Fibrella sp. HMF5335]|uniref:S9 family peptidase n=1 Tax=Fibrella rubiginis TaxID=2817060 RepID=A0A939GIA5_9BACT|nr:S9 family peptidase [Fibrella rubiginis]MBO0937266.1 S9 family peptidase [Fibrella rubiginis]